MINGTPTFLVVDEAHNFVPAEDPVDPHARRISQSIQRIAAEGRKYGLFLLLATQRPSKVRPGLLSECENICLLRLRSPIERGLAVETWALHEDQKHPRLSPLAKFDPGYGLLCGYWAGWDEIPFEVGRRRTKATGGDLPETWIGTTGLPEGEGLADSLRRVLRNSSSICPPMLEQSLQLRQCHLRLYDAGLG